MRRWLMYCWVCDRITDVALWVVGRCNRWRDNQLAWRLHALADRYDTRPTGRWTP